MCMNGSKESCILLRQMTELERKVAKIEAKMWFVVGCSLLLICILSVITFKLLDSQIYLLSGEKGLRVISDEAHDDMKALKYVKEAM